MPLAQPELPGMAEACAEVGLSGTPAGFATLTKKQRAYVLGFLQTGSQVQAAKIAGYSDPLSDGAKVRKAPEVQAILAQAATEVAKNADQLIKRAWMRSVSLHTMYENELAKPETLRSTAQLLKLSAELNKVDGLLGSLLGKISGVNISGEVKHTGSVAHSHIALTVPESALPVLAQMRRDVAQEAAMPHRN